MKLGIIGWFEEEHFKRAKENNLSALEFDINDDKDVPVFTQKLPEIKKLMKKYGIAVSAIGQWGKTRLLDDGSVNEPQLENEKELIRGAAELGCGVYIAGCNKFTLWDEGKDFTCAAAYLNELVSYAKQFGITVCLYNCDWNNFLCSAREWKIILPLVPGLKIKFDPSHAILHGRDWREEMRYWAKDFGYVHIKGTLLLDNNNWDFPPAGLDDMDWRSFMGYLYAAGYDGYLSLEPHSAVWQGELGDKGVAFSAKYINSLIV